MSTLETFYNDLAEIRKKRAQSCHSTTPGSYPLRDKENDFLNLSATFEAAKNDGITVTRKELAELEGTLRAVKRTMLSDGTLQLDAQLTPVNSDGQELFSLKGSTVEVIYDRN